jgi:hypothetical protein
VGGGIAAGAPGAGHLPGRRVRRPAGISVGVGNSDAARGRAGQDRQHAGQGAGAMGELLQSGVRAPAVPAVNFPELAIARF